VNTHLSTISQFPIDLSILVEGQPALIYQKDGRYFIEGAVGKRCAITVRNNSSSRLEIVESIDGRDVLRDAAASLAAGGMIIPSFERWVNSGWRLNDSQVAEFVFGDPGASVTAQATGSTSNAGVIGIAVFAEKQRTYTAMSSGIYGDNSAGHGWFRKGPTFGSEVMKGGATSDSYLGATLDSFSDSADAASSVSATSAVSNLSRTASAAPDLGVGMGTVQADHIGHTTFERASATPAVMIEIQYRSRQWLLDNGVITPAPVFPTAFSDNPTGYSKYLKK